MAHYTYMRWIAILFILFAWPIAAEQKTKILVMGDSVLAWNSLSGNTVARHLERLLNAEVIDKSASTVPIGRGGQEGIFAQYQPGPWDWIVIDGGGNDFLQDCRCGQCLPVLNRLISQNGQGGVIPKELAKLRARGHRLLYIGYMRTNGFASPIPRCARWVTQLEDRVAKYARETEGVYFLYNKSLVPDGDKSFHAYDRVHPSIKGSRAIAAAIAGIITSSDPPVISSNRANP